VVKFKISGSDTITNIVTVRSFPETTASTGIKIANNHTRPIKTREDAATSQIRIAYGILLMRVIPTRLAIIASSNSTCLQHPRIIVGARRFGSVVTASHTSGKKYRYHECYHSYFKNFRFHTEIHCGLAPRRSFGRHFVG
jgi:hypothetical protein